MSDCLVVKNKLTADLMAESSLARHEGAAANSRERETCTDV